MNFYFIKAEDDALFKNRPKISNFVLRPLNSMLNFEVDRLSLQKLEYKMGCIDYTVDYNCF